MELIGHVLVVDDDPAIRQVLEALLRQGGYRATAVGSGAEALTLLDRAQLDVVISDVKMPVMDGMQLLVEVSKRRPDLPVVLLTAHGTIPLAVEAMKRGAADFLLKPFERDEILFVVAKAMAVATRDSGPPPSARSDRLVGDSPAMADVQSLITRAARGTATVLIRGESGTGKELVARAIHDRSPRAAGPFVKVHCAALPETLLESELFGYEKGAFTGAATTKPGRVELADGGTLFLDEVGDIPLAMQVKLLRVIQERELERLGSRTTLKVDVRFVAATHRPLEELMARGQFREDLFYRLNVVPLWLPSLGQRPGDVAQLARHFYAVQGRANGRPDVMLEPAALALLEREPWPGNVRQLENFVERLVMLTDGPRITPEDVARELARRPTGLSASPAASSGPDSGGEPAGEAGGENRSLSLEDRRRQTERDAVIEALKRAGNNRTLAARLLNVSRRTLYTKLEEHGLL